MDKLFPILTCASLFMAGCGTHRPVEVVVANDLDMPRAGEMVELPADSVLNLLGSRHCYVCDASSGEEIPSQVTYDSKLIFRVVVPAQGEVAYMIHPSDTLHAYDSVAVGRIYPERMDDIAWENDLIGFRAYGPAMQAEGGEAYGYDIFFKHPSVKPMLERLYEPEINPLTWIKRDSLKEIDPALADEFVKSISYHIDHGLGMDCYAVGPTLGDGVAALVDGDSICFPWCYAQAEVLDNGPLRFTVRMDFASVTVGSDTAVVEHRLVSLDAGAHFNRCKVTYDGLSSGRRIVAGVPRRDDTPAVLDRDNGFIAYADPTQGPDNGKALLGVVMPAGADSVGEACGHILTYGTVAPTGSLDYRFGFAWDRADIGSMTEWSEYIENYVSTLRSPLKVTVR